MSKNLEHRYSNAVDELIRIGALGRWRGGKVSEKRYNKQFFKSLRLAERARKQRNTRYV